MSGQELITSHMQDIVKVLVKANSDGTFCDLDQVLERIPYKTTKESIQFTIRNLIKKGIIVKHPRERRRGKSRVVLSPTQAGYDLVKVTPVTDPIRSLFVEISEEDTTNV